MANVGKSVESAQHNLANVGESGESAQHGLANVGESRIFLKTAVLASTRTREKRRVSGEYSNSLNSPASSHCLSFFLHYILKRFSMVCPKAVFGNMFLHRFTKKTFIKKNNFIF